MRVVTRKPLKQSAQQEKKSRENFSFWLKRVPFEFLQDVYRHYQIRRDIPFKPFFIQQKKEITEDKNSSQQNQQSLSPPLEPIILRRSIFFLIITLLGIEMFFDISFISFRLLLTFISSQVIISFFSTNMFFLSTFIFLNISKIVFMLIAILQWISMTYEIDKKEIRYQYGILVHKEKIFLCAYTQEVVYTQSILGKLLNYGTIELYNPTIEERVYLDAVPNPKKHAEIIKNNVERIEQRNFIPLTGKP